MSFQPGDHRKEAADALPPLIKSEHDEGPQLLQEDYDIDPSVNHMQGTQPSTHNNRTVYSHTIRLITSSTVFQRSTTRSPPNQNTTPQTQRKFFSRRVETSVFYRSVRYHAHPRYPDVVAVNVQDPILESRLPAHQEAVFPSRTHIMTRNVDTPPPQRDNGIDTQFRGPDQPLDAALLYQPEGAFQHSPFLQLLTDIGTGPLDPYHPTSRPAPSNQPAHDDAYPANPYQDFNLYPHPAPRGSILDHLPDLQLPTLPQPPFPRSVPHSSQHQIRQHRYVSCHRTRSRRPRGRGYRGNLRDLGPPPTGMHAARERVEAGLDGIAAFAANPQASTAGSMDSQGGHAYANRQAFW